MAYYTDSRLWESEWKHTVTLKEFVEKYKGVITAYAVPRNLTGPAGDDEYPWIAHAKARSRDGDCSLEIAGRGLTSEEALQAWWENWLNYYAPEDVYHDRVRLMLRGAGDPRFQNFRIEGYDDDEDVRQE